MKKRDMISLESRRHARYRVTQVCVFLVVFYSLAVLSFVIPARPTRSDMENRELAVFPTFSVDALLDGSYFDDINTWFADTFPMRDRWMALNAGIKQCFGLSGTNVHGEIGEGDEIPDLPMATTTTVIHTTTTVTTATTVPTTITTVTTPSTTAVTTVTSTAPTASTTVNHIKPPGQDTAPAETIGAILTIGDSGFEYYHFSQSVADTYIGAVNRLGDQLAGTANVYDVLVPTSIDICVDPTVRAGVNSSDQAKAIRYLYGSMNGNVKTVDAFTALQNADNAGEYVYFRTDHHWTALGAYRTYEALCAAKGVTPTPLSAFTLRQFSGYLGSFYRDTQSAAMAANPDVVQAYIPPSTNSMTLTNRDGVTMEYPIITDVTTWNQLYKYNTFIGGDNPISTIQNPNKTDSSACLLIKESFGNAFAPFLVEDYQTVYVMDYRYFSEADARSIAQFVTENGVDDVVILNNMSATRNSYLVNSLNALVR